MVKKSISLPHQNLNNFTHKVKIREITVSTTAVARPILDSAHRDDYIVIIFQRKGKSKLLVDFQEVDLLGCCFYFIWPGQVHHYLQIEQCTGWLLATELLAIAPAIRQHFEDQALAQRPVAVPHGAVKTLEYALLSLSDALNNPLFIYRQQELIYHLISAYAGLLAGIYRSGRGLPEESTRAVQITRQFRLLIIKKIKTEKRPQQYAAHLNLSLAYLNECVKSTTGQPASYWIKQQIIIEAKRSLLYTTKSVKEVAFELGFDDQAYFARLFRGSCGMTPAAYRKTHLV